MTAGHYVTEMGEAYCAVHPNPSFCPGCRLLTDIPDASSCRACDRQMVRRPDQVPTPASEVQAWLTTVIGPHLLASIPVQLVDGSLMAPNQLGETEWRFDGQFTAQIRMKSGVHERSFQQTLAHEYGHVMLAAHPHDLSYTGGLAHDRHVDEEGFCEVVKYLWLVDRGGPLDLLDMRDTERNPDSVYGDGFRKMWKEFERVGSLPDFRDVTLGLRSRPAGRRKLLPWPRQTPQPTSPHPTPVPAGVVEGGSHRPHVPLDLSVRTDSELIQLPVPGPPRPTVAVRLVGPGAVRPDNDANRTPRPPRPTVPIVKKNN